MNIVERYFRNEYEKESYMYDTGDFAQIVNRDKRAINLNGRILRTGESAFLPYNSAITFANMLNYSLEIISMPRS